jgi:hypothetical protein
MNACPIVNLTFRDSDEDDVLDFANFVYFICVHAILFKRVIPTG